MKGLRTAAAVFEHIHPTWESLRAAFDRPAKRVRDRTAVDIVQTRKNALAALDANANAVRGESAELVAASIGPG